MRRVPLLLLLACSDGSASPSSGARSPRPAGAALDTEREAFTAPDGNGWGEAAGLRYLERTLGGGDPAARMPMLIMIHGLGDQPSWDWFTGAEAIDTPLRLIMPQAPTPYMGGFAWSEYRAGGGDPEALARGLGAARDRLARAITVLRAKRPTHGAPIVAGFSQGGMLSYALALHSPELVAFSHPISGLLPEPLWPRSKAAGKRYPRIAAMHGDADELVPIAADRRLVAHLRELGFDVELREFAGVAHTITSAMNAHSVALLNAAARELTPR